MVDFKNTNAKLTKKQAAVVVVADVGSAFKGAEWGAKIGTFLGGNVVIGGLLGAVGGAVVGSGFAWWVSSKSTANPPVLPVTLEPAYWSSTLSYSNDYEKAGYLHNLYCTYTFTASTLPSSFSDYNDYVVDTYIEDIARQCGIDTPRYIYENYLDSIKISCQEAVDIVTYEDAEDFINNCADPETGEIILLVIEKLFEIDEYDSEAYDLIPDYVDAYIELVEEDTLLTQIQKDQLFYALNICKYSASLWRDN